MRKKKAILNIISSLALQIVLICVNLIIPHFIIIKYGSEINGLINSITQFLGYISLLETGIGAVVKSVLYKELTKEDNASLSKIMNGVRCYFKKICYILVIYVGILCFFYPRFINTSFSHLYTLSLLLIISINSFMQYYFGIANQLLMQSDQKSYLINISKIIAYILSTVVMVILMLNNCSIQIVELTGTLVMILSPVYYCLYVKNNYNLDRNIKPDKNIIEKRWDGFSHQISAFIHKNTDIVLLTFMSNLSEVSVYSVYSLVTSGLRSIISTLTNGISSTFGNMYATNEKDKLRESFIVFDYINILIVCFTFCIAAILITPFVKLYVSGVYDVNYDRFLFGILIVISEAIYCFRCSYSNLIFIVGDFKETKFHGYTESIVNILVSLILIKPLGLVGIAIGTLLGMFVRFLLSLIYVNNNILNLNLKSTIKKYIINIFCAFIFYLVIIKTLFFDISSYVEWIKVAVTYSSIFIIFMVIVNYILNKNEFLNLYTNLKKIFNMKGKKFNETNNKKRA